MGESKHWGFNNGQAKGVEKKRGHSPVKDYVNEGKARIVILKAKGKNVRRTEKKRLSWSTQPALK